MIVTIKEAKTGFETKYETSNKNGTVVTVKKSRPNRNASWVFEKVMQAQVID